MFLFLSILLSITSLFVLLTPEPGVGVGDLDGQLSCPLNNQLPVLGGHIVGNLSAVSPVKVKAKDKLFYSSDFVIQPKSNSM